MRELLVIFVCVCVCVCVCSVQCSLQSPRYSKIVISINFLMDNDNVCVSVYFFIAGCIITCIYVRTRTKI